MAILPYESPNFKHFQSGFSNIFFPFQLRLSKTYSLNPSLENTLGLYIVKSLIKETKVQFEKILIELLKFHLVLTLQWQNES